MMRRGRDKWVYFIRPIGMAGPIKIGCSVAPDNRRASLESWSPFPLEIIAQIRGDEDTERRFHALFMKQHRGREWFDQSHDLDRVVASINLGAFDLSSLPDPVRVTHMRDGKPIRRTAAHRRQFSISLRCHHTERKTGFRPPVSPYGIVEQGSPEDRAAMDAYLKSPHLYGIPGTHPNDVARRREYLDRLESSLTTENAA